VRNLKADFSRVRAFGERSKFADEDLPIFVSGLDLNFRKDSQLFWILQLQADFVAPSQAVYRVNEQGHIVQVRPRVLRRPT
jgi:hypothetical protein